MMALNFLLAFSQLLIYLINYPNDILQLKNNELFQLQTPERYTPATVTALTKPTRFEALLENRTV